MAFNQWLIGINGAEVCQENIPHTMTPPLPAWTVDTSKCLVHDVMLLVIKSQVWLCHLWPWAETKIDQNRLQLTIISVFSCPVLVSLTSQQFQPSILGWQEWKLTWSSAFVHSEMLFRSLIEQGGYLNSITQFGHILLTSFINEAFLSNKCHFFIAQFWVHSSTCYALTSHENGSNRNIQTSLFKHEHH